ncbi:hypothetical protein [Vannielia sp. SX4]
MLPYYATSAHEAAVSHARQLRAEAFSNALRWLFGKGKGAADRSTAPESCGCAA